MNVLRLTKNIAMNNGDRFILFYGKVNDEFCDDDLVIGNIDFMLWRYFKEQGYRRVVFFDGANKITFYDHESRRLCLPEQESGAKDTERSALKGPLGGRNLWRSKSPGRAGVFSSPSAATGSSPSLVGSIPRQQSSMSDLSALAILDFIIQDDKSTVPTVIIFPLAEDIRNFQGTSFREIQNRMLKWGRVSSQKPHKCVFIFQQSTLEEVNALAHSYELHLVANFIKEKKDDTCNLVGVGFPGEQEIDNLIHYHRLRNGLVVDWQILDKIRQFLAKQRLSMQKLNSMLANNAELNKNTLLAWHKANMIKTTDYLVQNIEKDAHALDRPCLEEKLSLVHCQEDNISQLIDKLETWHAQVKKRQPLSFFLAGTSGVGKTYTAELLAEALQPLGYEYCYFAMSEFRQEHTVANLIGSPRGYVGSEEEPKLFAALNRSRRLVICFDEIEKAHKQILITLMQLLDKGFLSWNKGEGDFSECIICFTSNAQQQEMVRLKESCEKRGESTAEIKFQNAVRDILVRAQIAPPEVCRRIGWFLVYNPLTPEAIIKIAWQETNKLAKRYGLEVVHIAPEFLAEVAAAATNRSYGTGSVREMIDTKLGKILVKFSSGKEPGTKRIVINKTTSGYKAVPAVPLVDKELISSEDNMLNQGVSIYREQAAASSFLDTERLAKQLSPIFGQDDNISQLIDKLYTWHAHVEKDRPLSFFLAGTSGVGKTYTVKLLAEALQPLGYEYCYFAMSEFRQEHTVANLIGSPRGYVGSEEEPKLFAALNRSRRLVICFDEIEKAHRQILTALMQLLDEGFLSWNKGEGDFRECIICFTSNAQQQEMVQLKNSCEKRGESTDEIKFQNAVRDLLVRAQIAPEVCGRIGRFLVYNPLTPTAKIKIAWQEIKKLAKSYGLEVVYIAPEFLAEASAAAANSRYGTRPEREMVETKLGKALLALKKDKPMVRKVVLEEREGEYYALPTTDAAAHLSEAEMFARAEALIATADKAVSCVTDTVGSKPKRLLRLDELPTSLPERIGTVSLAFNPIDLVVPAVAYVEVENLSKEKSSGSGFVITPDGKLITNYHVITKAVSIRVRFDNRPDEWIHAELIDGDEEADIAVLKLQGDSFSYSLLAPYGDKVGRGEKVGLLGYPLGEDLASTVSYTEGAISNFRQRTNGVGLLQFDANAYHGSSGGPLFRLRDGRIIGILVGAWKEAVQINFAISINELYKRLLREQ